MGWGLLLGSSLCCWHNMGQKLLLLRKIPKLNCNSGLWVHPFNLARFVTYLCSESLQQLLIISACPLPSTRLSVKEREGLPVPRWRGRCGGLSPGRTVLQWLCVTLALCVERGSAGTWQEHSLNPHQSKSRGAAALSHSWEHLPLQSHPAPLWD